jgi:hypothetical protein
VAAREAHFARRLLADDAHPRILRRRCRRGWNGSGMRMSVSAVWRFTGFSGVLVAYQAQDA